jgi:asparagine synthase (glutamine-hydrolysing)
MSLQLGTYRYSDWQVSDDQANAIRKSLTVAGHADPGIWRAGSVCMGYADLPLRRDAGPAQPYVTQRAALTIDGRLDNRGDLELLLHDELCGEVSDAALALAAYEKWGPAGLLHLIGDWSAAIFDSERKQMVLASDFSGARPLYYSADGECVLWSTELKALVERVQPGELDEQYVAGFLEFGGYPGRTPYRGIHSVPPGQYLTASREGIQIRPFWWPPTGNSIRYARESDYEERLRELFYDAVRCRLCTDFPVISELSGGLDSSSVACMESHAMRSGTGLTPRIVTLSYEREGSLDRRFYELVGNRCGFESVRLSTSSLRFVAEDRTGDAEPAFWEELHSGVAEVARQTGARTLVTGTLGDLMMGNFDDDSCQCADLIRAGRMGTALKESMGWALALRLPVWGIFWRALLMALPAAMVSSRAELFAGGPEVPESKEDSLTPEFRARTGQGDGLSRGWMEARPSRRKHIRGLTQFLELRRLQPPEPLTQIYRTHPYVHRPLVEFMLSIPPAMVCGPGEPRRLMRRAFQSFWPPELRGRRSKDSFGGAFLDALRPLIPPLVNRVKDLQVVQRGYVNPESLKMRLERMAQSLDCNSGQLRHLILLELWLCKSRFGGRLGSGNRSLAVAAL